MESTSIELASYELRLRFYDVEAHIRSDSRAFVDLFARMYERFQARDTSCAGLQHVEITILTTADNRWGQPVLILDGKVWRLKDPRLLKGLIYDIILTAILIRVRSHFLIHAGVVAWNGKGIILAADASHGKTTLVLELVRRGFKYLSDEIAALGLADRRVHPFPRSLRIRPGTLELAGVPEAYIATPNGRSKQLLDIEEIQPGGLGEAADIGHIVILKDPNEESQKGPDGSERELSVMVERLDEALLTAVRQIEGVTEVCTGSQLSYPLLRVSAKDRTFVLTQIERLCQEQGLLVLDVIKRTSGFPVFEGPARLEAISTSEAVMELLRHFQGGHKSALLQEECGGSAARLYMELMGVVGAADCHQLYVGRLDEMAELVCNLVA